VKRLGKRATLHLFEDADHSFHVPARTGRKDADVRSEMLDAFADWARCIRPEPWMGRVGQRLDGIAAEHAHKEIPKA